MLAFLKKHIKKLIILVLAAVFLVCAYYAARKVYRHIRRTVEDEYFVSSGYDSSAERFKAEYEFYNGWDIGDGYFIRTLDIPSDNPMVYAFPDEVIQMIEEKQTFALYFGYPTCPWCRANMESILLAAADNGVQKIYYIDITNWRDTYELQDGEAVQTSAGTDGYQRLLELLGSVLDEYTLYDDEGNEVDVGEKRIYAPNVIAVRDGEAVSIADSTSLDPYGELTEENKETMYQNYDVLFKALNGAD